MYLIYFSHLIAGKKCHMLDYFETLDALRQCTGWKACLTPLHIKESEICHCIFIWHIKKSEKYVCHSFRFPQSKSMPCCLSGGLKPKWCMVTTFSSITAALILDRVTLETRKKNFLYNEREEIKTMAGNIVENQEHKKWWREICSQIYPSLSLSPMQHHPKKLQERLLYFGLMKTQVVVPVKSSLPVSL